jgi:hypothetical protein
MRNLPEAVKEKIREKYKDTKSLWIKTNLTYMDGTQHFDEGDTYRFFKIKNGIVDKLRKEKFSEVFPEWYEILRDYGDFDDQSK